MPKTATRKPKAPLKGELVNDEGLNAREAKFVDGYVDHGIGERAAIEAGYSENSARTFASRMLRKENIAAAIAKRQAKLAKKADITAERIVQEWASIGFANILDFIKIDEHGAVTIDLRDVPRETAAAISEITTGRDKHGTPYTKIKLHAKDPALEKLAKKLGLLKDDAPSLTLNFGFAGNAGLALMEETELQAIIALRLKDVKR